ncbi:hypothetical protein DdX_21344 [Ditylenchus destructor]|uniref:Uncharacterized protein n=1 Tax=Ditylenchus destructor TaxID=166010 RepID=A0AAD4QVM6_9BILA|nr:hypothetical protein DdX_21344 [Ditylenchus destructor]
MDNGTMVESFKYLNYCQLAKNSLVSKRFRDLIQTHRHSLALLYVNEISMDTVSNIPAVINIFDKELPSEAYNEWVIRNNYSKQVPRVCLIARAQGTQHIPSSYRFMAYALYKDASHRGWTDRTLVLNSCVKLNHENWPVFQHFMRPATDPFIQIGCVALTHRNDALTTLSGAVNSDHGHVRCKELVFHLRGNTWKSVIWIKKHVRCNQVSIYGDADSKHDEAILDFLLTGAHCTRSIIIRNHDPSKAVVNFVKKFMDLTSSDEGQFVEAIQGNIRNQVIELFKRDYSEFIVKEESVIRDNTHIFEFVNNAIGKKLQLTATIYDYLISYFSIKIINL